MRQLAAQLADQPLGDRLLASESPVLLALAIDGEEVEVHDSNAALQHRHVRHGRAHEPSVVAHPDGQVDRAKRSRQRVLAAHVVQPAALKEGCELRASVDMLLAHTEVSVERLRQLGEAQDPPLVGTAPRELLESATQGEAALELLGRLVGAGGRCCVRFHQPASRFVRHGVRVPEGAQLRSLWLGTIRGRVDARCRRGIPLLQRAVDGRPHLLVAFVAKPLKHRLAAPHLTRTHICSHFNQKLDNLAVFAFDRAAERRAQVDVRAALQQTFDHTAILRFDGDEERCLPIVNGVHVGRTFRQQLDCLLFSRVCRHHEEGHAIRGRVRVRAPADQEVHHCRVSIGHGGDERRVRVAPLVDQHTDGFERARLRSVPQRRLEELLVERRSTEQQQLRELVRLVEAGGALDLHLERHRLVQHTQLLKLSGHHGPARPAAPVAAPSRRAARAADSDRPHRARGAWSRASARRGPPTPHPAIPTRHARASPKCPRVAASGPRRQRHRSGVQRPPRSSCSFAPCRCPTPGTRCARTARVPAEKTCSAVGRHAQARRPRVARSAAAPRRAAPATAGARGGPGERAAAASATAVPRSPCRRARRHSAA
eukprot:717791-Prymnesium_polylepis.4